jgi:hypothetical protein
MSWYAEDLVEGLIMLISSISIDRCTRIKQQAAQIELAPPEGITCMN